MQTFCLAVYNKTQGSGASCTVTWKMVAVATWADEPDTMGLHSECQGGMAQHKMF